MPPEKIYYAVMIFLSALSILLSPFFYIRRPNHPKPLPKQVRQQWFLILLSNIIIFIALLAVWYFWFSN